MSINEIKSCEKLKLTDEKQIKQKEGSTQIGVSVRHFRRLIHNYR